MFQISASGTMSFHIHHEVKVGQFFTFNPGLKLLGVSMVENFCLISEGAVFLSGIKGGNLAEIRTGTFVTKVIPYNCKAVGALQKIIENY